MEFEEMKVVWDAQNQEPLYAVDESGLRARMEQSVREFNKGIFWRDAREIGIGLVVGLLFVFAGAGMLWAGPKSLAAFANGEIDYPVLDATCLLIGGMIWLYYSAYQYIGRKRQQQLEQRFDAWLRGALERTLAQVDYQIRLSQYVLFWGLLPVYVASGLGFVAFFDLTPPHLWSHHPLGIAAMPVLATVVMLVALYFDYRCKTAPIKNELLPRKRDLESLREKLVDSAC